MKIKSSCFLAMAVAATLGTVGSAYATNGYFLPGYGAKSIGMGGAGVAFAQDSLAAASNPAGILDVGTRGDFGLGIFNPPRRAYTDTTNSYFGDGRGQTESRSENDWFPVPNMGFTFQYDENIALGVAVYGNGLGTKYKVPVSDPDQRNFYNFTGQYGDSVGVDLMQVFMPITAAFRLNEENGVGVSIVPARQRFRANGIGQFAAVSSQPNGLSDTGYDFANGLGARLGWRGKFADGKVVLGATYATKVFMTKFNGYRGLFAEGGSFDVPENYAIGLALKPNDDLTLAFDVMRINYSDVPSVGNVGPCVDLTLTNSVADCANSGSQLGTIASNNGQAPGGLGRPDGMGFGWTDQTIYKVGVNYRYNDNWTFRAGYNYGKSPIPETEYAFNVLAPAVTEKHYAVGFTYNLGEQSILGFGSEAELTVSYLYAQKHKQAGLSALGQDLASGTQNAGYTEMEMFQHQLEISYGLKF